MRKEEAEKEKNAALAAGYLTKVGSPTGETPWSNATPFPKALVQVRLELQGLCIQVLELVEGTLLYGILEPPKHTT